VTRPGIRPPPTLDPVTLTVGFDLDLTLLDTRAGIAETYRRTAAELGFTVDLDAVVTRIGLPLADELAFWLPPERVPAAVETYRSLYRTHGVPGSRPLPGAAEAVAAVREAGGRAVVVTAKRADLARACLAVGGLAVDAVEGPYAGAGKGEALRRHGAAVYVGDHPLDLLGARAAGATAVGVTSGAHDAAGLAGADVVLPALTAFPGWFAGHLLDRRLADLDRRLGALGSVLVAFSGGADSAFLLAAAARALGPHRGLAVAARRGAGPGGPVRPVAGGAAPGAADRRAVPARLPRQRR
jgi:uncharacterized protein